MARRLGPIAATGLVVAGLGLSAGSMGAATGAATGAAADPGYQAPVVGQCFDMSAAELAAASYTEAAVDCAGPHTSVTIAVAQLPDGLAHDGRRFERFALETCLPAQRKVLGTSTRVMRLTAFNVGYFGPTAEQQAAGARWVRCDLVLGAPTAPQPLPSRLEVGRPPFDTAIARCLTGRDFHLTVCSSAHTHRATAVLKVKGTRFPSEKAWERIGTQRCRGVVGSRVYRFGWPSKASWKAGDRTLICYTSTRR